MDIETARYITVFYSQFFTDEEKVAQRHIRSTIKLENLDREKFDSFAKAYKKIGSLTDWQPVLDLIADGEESFIINTAKRIIKENSTHVFLNLCPKCNKLARTPLAKQCRHCGYDWHKEATEK